MTTTSEHYLGKRLPHAADGALKNEYLEGKIKPGVLVRVVQSHYATKIKSDNPWTDEHWFNAERGHMFCILSVTEFIDNNYFVGGNEYDGTNRAYIIDTFLMSVKNGGTFKKTVTGNNPWDVAIKFLYCYDPVKI